VNILIGADPEVFCSQDGKVVSAYGLIEGNKRKPQPVRNGAVQVDGMALEFNINPASNEEEFLYNISDVLGQLKSMIPSHEIIVEPIAEFGQDYIASQPDKAKELGCDPDFNAWTGSENPHPDGDSGFRTAAGHVHIGWTKDASLKDESHLNLVKGLVRQLDFFLGLPSILYDGYSKRREMYGKAGAYRPKSYGCEYRTLSNLWLTDTNLTALIYKNVHQALDSLRSGRDLSNKYGDIQSIINESNRDEAINIMNREAINYAL